MTILVACLGSGKGTWVPVLQLIDAVPWEAVYVVMPAFFADKYSPKSTVVQKIIINEEESVANLTKVIEGAIAGKLFGDTALSILSGGGKEHTAVLSALMKQGCGIRLVGVNEHGLVEY